jgi:catechol 2,3-dioxygenase-like lactoylglutathione lyase family enzyme
MKRLHIHMSVENLEQSVKFYSALFGAEPSKLKGDYAKWMVEDPRLNFAISTHGAKAGVDHLGIQVEADSELAEVRERISKAELGAFEEGETTCCYAKSDKTWVKDPAGMAWEAYKTMEDAEIFHEKTEVTSESACCAPSVDKSRGSLEETVAAKQSGGCCG